MTEESARAAFELQQLCSQYKFRQARDRAYKALSSSPDDTLLQYYAALAEYHCENVDEAEQLTLRLLQQQPHDESARSLYFDVLETKGRLGEAERVILDLIADAPEDPGYYAEYGWLMLRTYHREKARKLAETALRYDPEHLHARVLLILLAAINGNIAEAESELAPLLRDNPDELHSVLGLLIVLQEKSLYAEALSVAQILVRAFPDNKDFIDAVVEFRLMSHPLSLPLQPFKRFGWYATAALWAIGVFGLRNLRGRVPDAALGAVAFFFIALILYSWIYPPLMRRWIRYRGI